MRWTIQFRFKLDTTKACRKNKCTRVRVLKGHKTRGLLSVKVWRVEVRSTCIGVHQWMAGEYALCPHACACVGLLVPTHVHVCVGMRVHENWKGVYFWIGLSGWARQLPRISRNRIVSKRDGSDMNLWIVDSGNFSLSDIEAGVTYFW